MHVVEVHLVNGSFIRISIAWTCCTIPGVMSYMQSPCCEPCELHVPRSATATLPSPVIRTCKRTVIEPSRFVVASRGNPASDNSDAHRPAILGFAHRPSSPQIWPLTQSPGDVQLTRQSRTAGE